MNDCLKQQSQPSRCRKERQMERVIGETQKRVQETPLEGGLSTQPHQAELREVLPLWGAGVGCGAFTGSHGVSWTPVCLKLTSVFDVLSFRYFWKYSELGTRNKANYTDIYPSSAPCCTLAEKLWPKEHSPLSMGGWFRRQRAPRGTKCIHHHVPGRSSTHSH